MTQGAGFSRDLTGVLLPELCLTEDEDEPCSNISNFLPELPSAISTSYEANVQTDCTPTLPQALTDSISLLQDRCSPDATLDRMFATVVSCSTYEWAGLGPLVDELNRYFEVES